MPAADLVSVIKWVIVGILVAGMMVLLGLERMNIEGALGFVAGIVAIIFGGSAVSKQMSNRQ